MAVFSSGVLNRLDLHYNREKKDQDQYKLSVLNFFISCQDHLDFTQKKRKVGLETNKRLGSILRIGSRKSNKYSRIYETKESSLRFEHEMKGKFIEKYNSLLFSNDLQEFEQKLSYHFSTYFYQLLPLAACYMDWLVIKLRQIRKKSIQRPFLYTEYMSPSQVQSFFDKKQLITFLQFLVFSKKLDFKIDYLGDTRYRQVSFQVRDFLKYQNQSTDSPNYYKLRKLLKFFQGLQKKYRLTSFPDKKSFADETFLSLVTLPNAAETFVSAAETFSSLVTLPNAAETFVSAAETFSSLVTLPKLTIQKPKQEKCWRAEIWIVEELFYYKYPFFLPDFFQEKLTRDQFSVSFEVLKVFSSVEVGKHFQIKAFFQNYLTGLSNQQKTKMKNYFIKLVKVLKEHGLIESYCQIISNGSKYFVTSISKIEELTSQKISEGFVIYEIIDIDIEIDD